MREVIGRDKFGVLARDEQHVAKTLRREMPRFRLHLVDGEGHAQDRVVAREAAIFADVDALVGKIERREEPHGASEKLAREFFRVAGERLKFRALLRLKQRGEALEDAALRQRGIAELLREGHGHSA